MDISGSVKDRAVGNTNREHWNRQATRARTRCYIVGKVQPCRSGLAYFSSKSNLKKEALLLKCSSMTHSKFTCDAVGIGPHGAQPGPTQDVPSIGVKLVFNVHRGVALLGAESQITVYSTPTVLLEVIRVDYGRREIQTGLLFLRPCSSELDPWGTALGIINGLNGSVE